MRNRTIRFAAIHSLRVNIRFWCLLFLQIRIDRKLYTWKFSENCSYRWVGVLKFTSKFWHPKSPWPVTVRQEMDKISFLKNKIQHAWSMAAELCNLITGTWRPRWWISSLKCRQFSAGLFEVSRSGHALVIWNIWKNIFQEIKSLGVHLHTTINLTISNFKQFTSP